MKLWVKIYVFALVLFILTFNIAGIVILQKIHNDALEQVIDNQVIEQMNVAAGFNIMGTLFERSFNVNGKFDERVEKYLAKSTKEGSYIEILNNNNEMIFTNVAFEMPLERLEINTLTPEKRNYLIRSIEDKQYLFFTSYVKVNNSDYKFSTIKDISHIYDERRASYTFFSWVETGACLIFALFMILISKFITRPINELVHSTQKISSGNYTGRIKINSEDEFSVLSNHFNSMAQIIEDTIQELGKTNNEKQSLLDNLTHELKTPLTSIIGYADLLKKTKYNEEVFYEALDYIYNEGKRLEQLSYKMMDLVTVRTDNIHFEYENILEIMNEVKSLSFQKRQEKNIDLIIEGKALTLYIEKDLIKILISNLVDNAIKASKLNGIIHITLSQKDTTIGIEVEDSGIGIPKEDLSRIGEPFYMVDKSRSRKFNGAGLGFSICKKIVQLHKGELFLESELGKGTKVKIIFGVNLLKE